MSDFEGFTIFIKKGVRITFATLTNSKGILSGASAKRALMQLIQEVTFSSSVVLEKM